MHCNVHNEQVTTSYMSGLAFVTSLNPELICHNFPHSFPINNGGEYFKLILSSFHAYLTTPFIITLPVLINVLQPRALVFIVSHSKKQLHMTTTNIQNLTANERRNIILEFQRIL